MPNMFADLLLMCNVELTKPKLEAPAPSLEMIGTTCAGQSAIGRGKDAWYGSKRYLAYRTITYIGKILKELLWRMAAQAGHLKNTLQRKPGSKEDYMKEV